MKKEIKVRQHDNTDCAAACVASVCTHYGLRLPLLRIREACGTGPDGTSLQGIIDACGRLGMDAAGLRAKEKHITDLQEAVKPVILHLRKKNGWLHYVVLYALDDSTATVMDPEDEPGRPGRGVERIHSSPRPLPVLSERRPQDPGPGPVKGDSALL